MKRTRSYDVNAADSTGEDHRKCHEFAKDVVPLVKTTTTGLSEYIALNSRGTQILLDRDQGYRFGRILRWMGDSTVTSEVCANLQLRMNIKYDMASQSWRAPRESFNLVNHLLCKIWPNAVGPVWINKVETDDSEIQCDNVEADREAILKAHEAYLKKCREQLLKRTRRTLRQN